MNCANISRKDSNWENMLKVDPMNKSCALRGMTMTGIPQDASANPGRDLKQGARVLVLLMLFARGSGCFRRRRAE